MTMIYLLRGAVFLYLFGSQQSHCLEGPSSPHWQNHPEGKCAWITKSPWWMGETHCGGIATSPQFRVPELRLQQATWSPVARRCISDLWVLCSWESGTNFRKRFSSTQKSRKRQCTYHMTYSTLFFVESRVEQELRQHTHSNNNDNGSRAPDAFHLSLAS